MNKKRENQPSALLERSSTSMTQPGNWEPPTELPQFCVHQLFEAQAIQSPDRVAVLFEDQVLTYQQLNERANQLAHSLRQRGVKPDTLVGLSLERSLEMVIGILGILKAGGAYVPIDPAYPDDRIAFILQDTQIPILLTQSQWSDRFSTDSIEVICLDSDSTLAQQSLENPDCQTELHHLMYVIYTSGSTGHPKGVMIPHAGICNQLAWRQNIFSLEPSDRVLQNISLSFDPSVWQIFWPLTSGAQLFLPHPNGHRDSAYLVQLIAQAQISVIALVPSMLQLFLAEPGLEQCDRLKFVFCGGEALSQELVQRFYDRLPQVALYNVYGPTEASIDATFWPCQREITALTAPIGRPISQTQIYLLNSLLQPVAAGEPGELYIGGVSLARGYLNRPELTAEKFIFHPTQPTTRLYKTGDLARYLEDGNLEFLGRIDHQVKIRGFRIELEEIEATLKQHPDIQQSVVLSREDVPGNSYLVAYLIPSTTHTSLIRGVKNFLKEKLPDYMVPTHFVLLEEFPLNINGKLDRSALPAPQHKLSVLESSFIPPKNPVELSLQQLWEQVLQIDQIGVQDNFFELGGNSLQAGSLMAKIREKFGRSIALNAFFQAPTIAELAHLIQQEEHFPITPQRWVPIQPNGSKTPLFCIHSKTGNVFNYYPLARYLGDDQPIYGLQAKPEDGLTPLQIEELAKDYIQAIQTIQTIGPYFLCGYSFGGLIAYEMARQLQIQGQEIGLLVMIDVYNTQNPWFKASLETRIISHIRRFSQMSLTEKLKYLPRKIKHRFFTQIQTQNSLQLAYEQATQAYQPQAFSGSVLLFRALEKPEELQAQSVSQDSHLGWGALITGTLEIQSLPCNHFDMLNEPYVMALCHQLKAKLEAIYQSKSP